MSHSQGAIKVGESIYWVEYNGTVDVLLPHLYNTQEELVANWRRRDWKNCSCNPRQLVDGTVTVTYGRGFNWPIKVCLICMVAVDPLMPFDDERIHKDGIADWYPNKELYK